MKQSDWSSDALVRCSSFVVRDSARGSRHGPPQDLKHGVHGGALVKHANTWPPGPVADEWRTGALYNALCRGYRFGCGVGELCEPHGKAGSLGWCESRRGTASHTTCMILSASCPPPFPWLARARSRGASRSTAAIEQHTPIGRGGSGRSRSAVSIARSRGAVRRAGVMVHFAMETRDPALDSSPPFLCFLSPSNPDDRRRQQTLRFRHGKF